MASLDKRLQAGSDDGCGALVDLLDSEATGPSKLAEEAEQSEEVRRAVDELPESIRQAVLLVYFQGMKYREAAEVMSIPVGTVKSRLHAAIQKLDEVYQGVCDDHRSAIEDLEELGQGVDIIYEAMRREHHPEPEFRDAGLLEPSLDDRACG